MERDQEEEDRVERHKGERRYKCSVASLGLIRSSMSYKERRDLVNLGGHGDGNTGA